jgi:hypothetical protein
MRLTVIILSLLLFSCNSNKKECSNLGTESQEVQGKNNFNTYCNPIDIDYTYMVYNSSKNISYRSGADPAVIQFRGEYYMFVTRSFG